MGIDYFRLRGRQERVCWLVIKDDAAIQSKPLKNERKEQFSLFIM